MRACYFVQTHIHPEQIHRLIRTLKRGSPEARVLVGHDFSSCHLDLGPLADLSGVDLFGFEGPLDRAGMGIIEPYFTALDWLAAHAVDFDWLIYLTGQDYPTLPLAAAEGFLAQSGRDGFLSHWDIRARPGYWGDSRRGLRRYLYQYRPAPPWAAWLRSLKGINSLQSHYHLSSAYGLRLGVRADPSPFSDAFPCYAGDQWQALSRPVVEYLRTALRERADLVEYFRHTLCPCEAIVQTLLVNSGRFNLANDSLRYVDFTGSREGRPRLLGAADFAPITSGRYHFARKIDRRVDGGLLDRLDDWVLAGGIHNLPYG
ncbi:MAG TPA: beta-1,6-N-acetylglucosaminyltransferase [Thermoanaerobaculia bacterium]|nr:beta-1,6-N-acetylglucosaminyltransferase [Thermoanaerobaculia bacterium]